MIALLALLLQQQDPEKLFKQAVQLCEQEKFVEGQQLFRYIAQKWPDTETGKKAKKRGGDNAFLKIKPIVKNGPALNRLDVVLTGDGYLIDKMKTLDGFSTAVLGCFRHENATIKEYFSYFNFYTLYACSKEQGVDTRDRNFDTVFGGTVANGMLHSDYPLVSQMLDEHFPEHDPYAIISIWSASGHSTGGGSMANIAGTGAGPVIHEFGHAFAGLGDEYAQAGSLSGANVSPVNDPDKIPWKHWLKDAKLAEALGLGVFPIGQGAGLKYTPTNGRCVMNAGGGDFCAVCREVFVIAVYNWLRPIDDATPEPRIEWDPKAQPDAEVWVIPMKPASHELKVEWRFAAVSGKNEPEPMSEQPWEKPETRPKNRPVPTSATTVPFDGTAVKSRKKPAKDGRMMDTVKLADLGLKSGTYTLTVSVTDEPSSVTKTKQGPILVPWVLVDDRKLLEERRRWVIRVR